jgi:transcription initiation factor TFIIB
MSKILKQNTISEYSKIVVCPNCNVNYNSGGGNKNNNSNIITDPETGEQICGNCGLVVSSERTQETTAEWRYSNSDSPNNDRIRTGMPTSLARHDMGLSTIIGRTDKDYTGNRIATSIKSTIDRLRMLDYRTQLYSSTDRSLKKAFYELDTLRDKLALTDSVVEKAAYIYRKAQSKNSVSYACCCHIYCM